MALIAFFGEVDMVEETPADEGSVVAAETRRPISSRNRQWAHAGARWLARVGVTPNAISIASVLCAAIAGVCLVLHAEVEGRALRITCLVGAVAGIQVRLLCNLFDGMVAVEHGKKTKSGEIFNELPDRFADLCIFAGAGYVDLRWSWLPHLGWGVGALAILTAYVRALGASTGAGQQFLGPMAKQHRMAVMTLCCLISVGAVLGEKDWPVIPIGLGVIGIGCLITIVRRTIAIVRALEAK